MNSMAEDGITLSRYYAELDCTPGRSTILTGKYPFTTGMAHSMVYYYSNWGLSTKYDLVSNALSDVGYSTHAIGKWDIGHAVKDMWPTRRGFDSFFGLLSTDITYQQHYCCDYSPVKGIFVRDLLDGEVNADDSYSESKRSHKNYATNMLGDKAREVVEAASDDSPLFIYLAFNAPHQSVSREALAAVRARPGMLSLPA